MRELGAANPLRVYLGRDDSKFAPADDRDRVREELDWAKDGTVGIMVSRIEREKGTRELAKACRGLFAKHPEFRMVVVGGGSAKAELETFANENDFADRLLILGDQPPKRIPKFLQAADLFVLPSYSEGMPQAVLEAMNCGLPVVGTNVGGIPEAVFDSDNGLLVEARNANALESAINHMISDPTFREKAGKRSREIALEVFGSDVNAALLASALKQTLVQP